MPIATGGMAMVWAARLKGTRGFQKIVAVKTMLPKLSEDAQFEQMFLDEAALASQVRHPHVVEILDLGEQEGVLYLVMEWINGVPLNQVIKSARAAGGVPLPVAVRICMQACAGLHAAHELQDNDGHLVGLVHRDISPQNLLVTYDGVTKVVDFGIAKATAVGGSATQAGQVKGKIAYMAPEQVKGQTIDRRVDVFAMGVVLYALTTGKHPFRKESDAATLYQICAPEPVPSPRKIIPGYPIALERVVMQALAKNPARRFPSANDLLRALDQSLPATMRASTDEEVAKFIQSLFGEKQEQQRTALQTALARADERQNDSKVKLREFLDSQPPPSIGSGSGSHSGVSEVSLVTEAGQLATGTNPDLVPPSLPGVPSIPDQTGSVAAVEIPRPRKVGWIVAAAAGVAVLALGLGAFFALAGRGHAAAGAASAAVPTAAANTAQAEPEEKQPEPTATASASAAPEPEPEPSASADEKTAKPAPAAHHWGGRPATTAKPAATKPTPTGNQGATSWKHDPGF